MERTLTIEGAIQLLKATPENLAFDWKTDFTVPNDENKQGEFIKDVAAISNAISSSYGFILYGVDPRRPDDPVLGITSNYDDAKLQQLVGDKLEPRPVFLYYELCAGDKTIGVLQVKPTGLRPHIIRVDLGKIRKGQIVIRRGSSTDGVTMQDMYDFFYSSDSKHFQWANQQMAAYGQQMHGEAAYLREARAGREEALRNMEIITGTRLG